MRFLMNLELKRFVERNADERAAYQQLAALVYPPEELATMPERDIVWAAVEWSVMVWNDGQLVSHVGVVTRNVKLEGRAVHIGGIGGVMTHPDARGRGYASAGMKRATTLLAGELDAAFGLLVCPPAVEGFYARLGWRRFGGKLLVEQHGATVEYIASVPMLLALREHGPEIGEINLLGLPW